MFGKSKSNLIVFNGEIYNTDELRREITNLGVEIKSNSDIYNKYFYC